MKKQSILVASLITFALSITHAQAAEPLELQKVMQELGRNMQVITDGISREDWELVAKTAPHIAEHPQPPVSEKMRIMKFMGPEMSKFKALDGKTHEAAHDLLHAANEKDGQKVIAAFQQVQTTCLNCHQTFRGKFVEHFYGAPGK
ncbi:MAG: cytochrome c class II [Gallionellaceae bacterium]|nr:MAG: cytochrome c class II [Gallionellaceae bacterium]